MPRTTALRLLLPIFLAACGGTTVASPTAPSATVPATTAPATGSLSTATPAATGPYAPAARTSAAITWDPTSKRVLLFGGDSPRGPSDDFEAWDGTAWMPLAGSPPARDDGLLVADPARGVVVLTGGRNGQRVLTDTWEWNGTAWTKLEVDAPTPRAHAAAAYDPVSKRMLVYGGVSDAGTLRDTWAWDGTSWQQLETKGIPGRVPNGMAWDAVRKQLLVLAVNLDAPNADQTYPSELWGWTGKAWERVADGGPSFSPLQQFVEGPEHPWLVDGGALQKEFATYEWEGTHWSQADGAAPPVRNGQAVALDHERRQLVLFGGFLDNTVFDDTWLFDEGAWHEAAP